MWKYHKWSINYWKLKDLKGKKFEIQKVVQNNGLLLLLLSQWRRRRGLLFILEVSFKSIGLFHLIPPTLFSSFLLRIECAKVVENSSTLKRTQIHTHTRICLAYFLFKYDCMLTAPESPFFPFIFVDLWELPASFFFFHLRIFIIIFAWNVENGIKSDAGVCTRASYIRLQMSLFPLFRCVLLHYVLYGSYRMYI